MNIKAIIFDMDGLMFDTERLALENWTKSGKETGYKIDESLMLKAIGKNLQDNKKLFIEYFGTAFPFETIKLQAENYLKKTIDKEGVPIKKGLIALLDYCKQKSLLTAVATSTSRLQAEALLRRANVLDYFDVVVCGDEIGKGKPNPEIFLLASKKLNVSSNVCVVLEDSEYGILGAHKANMIPIFVPDLVEESEIIKQNKQFKCQSLIDVIDVIEKLLKN